MYGTNYGSVSGIIHLVARRPVFAATVALVAVSVAYYPSTPPPPPSPLPPAVVTLSSRAAVPAAEPTPYAGSHKNVTYTCEFGKAVAPTNLCKATLDSIALFMNNDSAATVKVTGSMTHALAVRKYFVEGESKLGISSDRIKIDSDGNDTSNVVTIEQIP